MPHANNNDVCIAYLRHQHEMYKVRMNNLGGPINAAILRLIMVGHLENKPYDISDLAYEVGVSRQSVMRRLDEMVSNQLIYIDKDPTHAYARPTPYLVKYTKDQVPGLIVRQFKVFSEMHAKLIRRSSWTSMAKRLTPLITAAAAMILACAHSRPHHIEIMTETHPLNMDWDGDKA